MKVSLKDILMIVVPVTIMILLTPIFPDKVAIHYTFPGDANLFIDRKYAFVLGLLPFIIYKGLKLKRWLKEWD